MKIPHRSTEEEIRQKWKEVTRHFKITLTPKEREQIKKMMDAQKRANDPKTWEGIVFD